MDEIDSMKKEFENPTEWSIRREFLIRNVSNLSKPRLECLSNCFVNIELYGAGYPKPVMDEVKQLSEGLVEEFQPGGKRPCNLSKINFVPSKEEQGQRPPASRFPQSKNNPAATDTDLRQVLNKQRTPGGGSSGQQQSYQRGTAPSPNQSFHSPGPGTTHKPPPEPLQCVEARFRQEESRLGLNNRRDTVLELHRELCRLLEVRAQCNLVSVLNMAASKLHLDVQLDTESVSINSETGEFTCRMVLEHSVRLVDAVARTKKEAKTAAVEKFVNNLSDGEIEVVEDGSGGYLVQPVEVSRRGQSQPPTKSSPVALPHKVEEVSQSRDNVRIGSSESQPALLPPALRDFYLREMLTDRGKPNMATSIIHQSVDFFHIPIDFNYTDVGTAGVGCQLRLGDAVIGQSVGCSSRPEARTAVCEIALKRLRRQCWTLLVKQSAEFMMEQAKGGIGKQPNQISVYTLGDSGGSNGSSCSTSTTSAAAPTDSGGDSLGMRMLKKMGWSGAGGLGKNEEGRREPIPDIAVVQRRGLGFPDGTTDPQLGPRVRRLLMDFKSSDREEDMYFSTDFTNDERRIIHSECVKLNLSSRSWNTADGGRCLVICRKRSPQQLFNWILSNGGQTTRYELIAPGQHPEIA